MRSSDYGAIVDRELGPALAALGFSEVVLKGCICPERLFQNVGIWFGTSWDYRDRCLDLHLGTLYWIKDVMPRVTVVGELQDFLPHVPRGNPKDEAELLSRVRAVAESLPRALQRYREHPELQEKSRQWLRPMIIWRSN